MFPKDQMALNMEEGVKSFWTFHLAYAQYHVVGSKWLLSPQIQYYLWI